MFQKSVNSAPSDRRGLIVLAAAVGGYLVGVLGSLVWVGGMAALSYFHLALVVSPIGFLAAFDFWGVKAGLVLVCAFTLLVVMNVLARLRSKPFLASGGSFLGFVMLGALGGASALRILSW